MIRTFFYVLLACLAVTTARAQNADTFPRLAGIFIGDPRPYEDPNYQRDIAKLDYAILSVFPGWEEIHGITMEEVAKRIKAINPRIRLFLYFCPESREDPNNAWAAVNSKLYSQKWWAYTSGVNGTKVLSDFGDGTYIVNLTNFTPADSSGKRANEWMATHAIENVMNGRPSVDGTYTDNVFWKPRMDVDWNRDGSRDSQNNAAVQKYYREGTATYLNHLKRLMPGRPHIGNVADWGKAESDITEYHQVLNGGVMENLIGKDHSVETYLGWHVMMGRYRKTMAAFAEPRLGMFSQSGSRTDYRGFRYGFASALLDDGYYAYHDINKGFSGVVWFDEFDVELGTATSTPPTAAWQQGVWRRDFQGGIALVNPKGNGDKNVTIEGEFRRINGEQDRAVNNGQAVTKVTLRDRDGIILLRKMRRPRPPAAITVRKGS
jgi:hypothetical protein